LDGSIALQAVIRVMRPKWLKATRSILSLVLIFSFLTVADVQAQKRGGSMIGALLGGAAALGSATAKEYDELTLRPRS